MSEDTPVFEVIQLGSVRRSVLQEALRARHRSWPAACHVTATMSLTDAFWREGDLAISIAHLIDLIVVGGRAAAGAGSVAEYPSAVDFASQLQYADAVREWSARVEGGRMRLSMQINDGLRKFARNRTGDRSAADLLVRERREFQRAMQTLVAAGLSPDSEEFKPSAPLSATARDAWRALEESCPAISWVRDDLWHNAGSAEVKARCRAALTRVFGPRERWTVVHHGFYFYTPPQWALFRLLRDIGIADQYFVVHDDGTSPMFEIWRRFFSSRWGMPDLGMPNLGMPVDDTSVEITPQADAMRAAWRGERVATERLQSALRIIEFKSPAEFIRSTLHSNAQATGDGARKPRLFAAQHDEVKRFGERLGPVASGGCSVLAQLPIGAFLLRLHECIQGGDGGTTQLVLTADAVRDIATSGFLELPPDLPSVTSLRGAWARAMPFFRGCRFASDWDSRATSLERTVVDQVSRLGSRDPSHDDVQRMTTAIANPMRLVPWADLSEHEAKAIRLVIHAITRTVRELARSERVRFSEHAEFIARHIRKGAAAVPKAERERLEAQLGGFSIGLDGDIDVSGLIDVVGILLGREAAPSEEEAPAGTDSGFAPLRSLDALGLVASKAPIHLANLADGAFPTAVPAVGWPFRREDIVDPVHIGRALLETRSEHSALGDLYLLWLALDGVDAGVPVTLSWISEIAGDPRNLSAILGMLRRPSERSLSAVAAHIGGLEVLSPPSSGTASPRISMPVAPSCGASESKLTTALEKLPRGVASMALACPRWLASHWLFGPTVAHGAEFQHFRLYGNVLSALERFRGMSADEAKACADGLWRFMTPGERASSRARRVVKASGVTAKYEWLLTLEGKRDGDKPVSLAYRSAAGYALPLALRVLQASGAGFLPPAPPDERGGICKFCPAQSRCLEARRERDEST